MKIVSSLKDNLGYIVVSFIVLIFSFLTIKGSVGGSLEFSFPAEGVDYSTISWGEVPIDGNGQEFSVDYKAWDIGQLG